MKKNLILALTVAFGVAMAGTAFAKHATTTSGDSANGINSSRHNLSTSGSHVNGLDPAFAATRAQNTAGTSEMCAICHTPHFTDRSVGPLWNRTTQDASVVTTYGELISSASVDGTNLFSTLACLSCHDGVTTLDSVTNKPGKATGAPSTWNFWEGGENVANYITSTRLNIGDADGSGLDFGAINLANDHPIGVAYNSDRSSLRAVSTVISSISMAIDQEDGTMMAPLVDGNLWAVKGFISETGKIQDLLRAGKGGETDSNKKFVQCSSCHDLHYKNNTNPDMDFVTTYGVTDHNSGKIDGLFLRRVGGNSDSGLCRTCHDK